jgi:hypothetical protein
LDGLDENKIMKNKNEFKMKMKIVCTYWVPDASELLPPSVLHARSAASRHSQPGLSAGFASFSKPPPTLSKMRESVYLKGTCVRDDSLLLLLCRPPILSNRTIVDIWGEYILF